MTQTGTKRATREGQDGVAVGFYSVPLVFDLISHCSACGSPSVPVDRTTGLTLCCGVARCQTDDDGMLRIGPFGVRYCCEGMARRCVGPGLIELRTRDGSLVPSRVVEADGEDLKGSEEALDGRARARAIRRLKKKLSLNKITPEAYAAEMSNLEAS